MSANTPYDAAALHADVLATFPAARAAACFASTLLASPAILLADLPEARAESLLAIPAFGPPYDWNVISSYRPDANLLIHKDGDPTWEDAVSFVVDEIRRLFPVYDYAKMKSNRQELHRDLVEYLYHPRRIAKHLRSGKELDEYIP